MNRAVARQAQFEAILQRHGADLSHLRGSRGLVRCVLPGHNDRSASLSLDLSASLFHCFGCQREGGLRELRGLLGEGTAAPARPRRWEGPLQDARRAVMAREDRAAADRAEWAPWQFANGHIGRCLGAAHRARAFATRLGPDDARTWPLVERAAAVERDGLNLETALDAILLEGRIG